jgi:tRNA-intron endonuclease
MKISGELLIDKIIIKKSKDIGRLYNKSRIGNKTPDNKLQLNLIEGIFLLDEEKINIFENGVEASFSKLVKLAETYISRFEIKFLIFKDLRARGCLVKTYDINDEFDLYYLKKHNNKSYYISAFSERDLIKIQEIKYLIESAFNKGIGLWFAIVDEEGDLTYYDVSIVEIKGNTKKHKFLKTSSYFLENRVVIFSEEISEELHKKEFFGKPFNKGLQLSLVEALYLLEKKVIEIHMRDDKKLTKNEFKKIIMKLQPDLKLRYVVFQDLKKRGLIVKTGFKFGTHFRVYTKKPEETHAEFLVHVVDKSFKGIWADISRAVRLAHSVNKEIVFAKVDSGKIDYIKFGRLRP